SATFYIGVKWLAARSEITHCKLLKREPFRIIGQRNRLPAISKRYTAKARPRRNCTIDSENGIYRVASLEQRNQRLHRLVDTAADPAFIGCIPLPDRRYFHVSLRIQFDCIDPVSRHDASC